MNCMREFVPSAAVKSSWSCPTMVPACHPTAPIHHNEAMKVLIYTHRCSPQKGCKRYGVWKEIWASLRGWCCQIFIRFQPVANSYQYVIFPPKWRAIKKRKSLSIPIDYTREGDAKVMGSVKRYSHQQGNIPWNLLLPKMKIKGCQYVILSTNSTIIKRQESSSMHIDKLCKRDAKVMRWKKR